MLVSIIIPSFNHALFIEECIRSVLKQSYKDFELLIIDDGSSDNSVSLIESFNDDRIHLFLQENRGAHAAINRGIALSKGEIISILNSDDVFHEDRLSEAVSVFQSTDYNFISSWIDIIDNKSKKLGTKKSWRNMLPWQYESLQETFNETDDYQLNALMTNFVSTTSNMIFRRCVYEDIGGMRNLRFAHDWDFLLRVCAKFKCFELNKPLLQYRVHGNNTISSSRKGMLFEICWVYAANIEHFASGILFQINNNDRVAQDFCKLYDSMNFQGNDKMVWALMSLFNGLKLQGIKEPENILLDDNVLRDIIINKIIA